MTARWILKIAHFFCRCCIVCSLSAGAGPSHTPTGRAPCIRRLTIRKNKFLRTKDRFQFFRFYRKFKSDKFLCYCAFGKSRQMTRDNKNLTENWFSGPLPHVKFESHSRIVFHCHVVAHPNSEVNSDRVTLKLRQTDHFFRGLQNPPQTVYTHANWREKALLGDIGTFND